MNEKALIKACRKGNQIAQRQLYDQFAQPMFNICMCMVKTREEAEDILQESFIQAFSQLKRFRGESSFGTWLKRIVINKSINALKKRKVNFEFIDSMHILDKPEDIHEEQENMLNVKHIKKAMDQLPDGYRTIFSLYLLEGYDHTEIAGILNISESTSRSQYKRAKQKVKTFLMQKHRQRQKEMAT